MLAKNAAERRRKRDLDLGDDAPVSKRSRSASSFDSVSTISTNRSRSTSPPHRDERRRSTRRLSGLSERRSRYRRESASPPYRRQRRQSRSATPENRSRSRRREYDHGDVHSRPSGSERSPELQRRSPPRTRPRSSGLSSLAGRKPRDRSRSRSPYRGYRPKQSENTALVGSGKEAVHPAPTRQRSLSPYSKRVALSKA